MLLAQFIHKYCGLQPVELYIVFDIMVLDNKGISSDRSLNNTFDVQQGGNRHDYDREIEFCEDFYKSYTTGKGSSILTKLASIFTSLFI